MNVRYTRPTGRQRTGPERQANLDLRAEGVGVAVQDGLHRRLAEGLVLLVIAAGHAVARVAVAPAGKALAVQLQAAGVLAVAVLLGVRNEIEVPGALAQLLLHLAGSRHGAAAARPAFATWWFSRLIRV